MTGFHFFVKRDTWWIGVQILPAASRGKYWVCVQPLPCVGFAFRVRA